MSVGQEGSNDGDEVAWHLKVDEFANEAVVTNLVKGFFRIAAVFLLLLKLKDMSSTTLSNWVVVL